MSIYKDVSRQLNENRLKSGNLYLEIEIIDPIGPELDMGASKFVRLQAKMYKENSMEAYTPEVVFGVASSLDTSRHRVLFRAEPTGVRVCHVLDLAKIAWNSFKTKNEGPGRSPRQAGHFALALALALRPMCPVWVEPDPLSLAAVGEPPLTGTGVNAEAWARSWEMIDAIVWETLSTFMKRWGAERPRKNWSAEPIGVWYSLEVRSLLPRPRVRDFLDPLCL